MLDHGIVLAMETDLAAEILNQAHGFIGLSIIQGGVVRRNRSDERFEGDAALLIERRQIAEVFRDQTAIKAVIRAGVWGNELLLAIKERSGRHGRVILQGHVKDGRKAADCGGLRAVEKVLAPGIARIV